MRAMRLWGRLATRVLAVGAGLAVLALFGAQCFRVISMNLDLAHRLASVRSERAELLADNVRLRTRIRRLQTPDGAIPEIHDVLHLVRPHEEIIYLQSR